MYKYWTYCTYKTETAKPKLKKQNACNFSMKQTLPMLDDNRY